MLKQIFYAFTILPPTYVLGRSLEFEINVKGEKEPFDIDVSIALGKPQVHPPITAIESANEFSIEIGEGEPASRIIFRARDSLIRWTRKFDLEEGLSKDQISDFVDRVVYPSAMTDLNLFIDALRQSFDHPYFERLSAQQPLVIVTVTPDGKPIQVIVSREFPWQEKDWILSATVKDVSPEVLPTSVPMLLRPVAWIIRSDRLKQIQEICSGQLPQVWDNIFLDAWSAFHSGSHREALLNAHTSIESRLYDLIDRALKARDVTKEVREIVHRASFEKRMRKVLKSLYGNGFMGDTWRDCNWLYDTRNKVIHRGISVSHADAEKAIQVARAALRFLDNLQRSAPDSATQGHK